MNNIVPEHEYGAPSDTEEELITIYACDCELINVIKVPICCPIHGKPIISAAHCIYFIWGDEDYFEGN